MNGYVAFFGSKRIEVHAETSAAAYTEAVAQFKPAKSKRHLVSVTLAELNTNSNSPKQVVHTPDF